MLVFELFRILISLEEFFFVMGLYDVLVDIFYMKGLYVGVNR